MNDLSDIREMRAATLPVGRAMRALPNLGEVQGVVLAGSHSWGDCVVKEVVSQLQLPIAGQSLLGHTLDWLSSVGTATTTLCANSRTRCLCRRFGERWGSRMDLHYLEDRMPRGPAGCVRDVASCQDADLFVVAEGGVLPLISLPAILEAHRHAEAALTVVVGRRPLSRGMVDEPGGIYVFSREALDQVPPRGYQDIKEMLIPRLHAMGARISCYEIAGRLVPRVKGAASYLAVNTWMLERTINETRRWQDYKFQGEARIHRSAELGEGVELIGPVLLGAGSRVGRATMIIGPTTVGMQCVIGRDAVVSRSAMWDGSRVGDRSVVDHSILTHRAVVASGTHISEGIGVMPPTRREAMRGAASDILRESEKDAPRVPPVTASRRQGSNGKKQCEQRSPSLQQGWTSKAYS